MKRSLLLVPILSAGCLWIGFISYRQGLNRAAAVALAGTAPAGKSPQAMAERMEAIPARSAADLESQKERLMQSYAACPSAEHDWILRGQAAAVLATMSPAELESMLTQLLGGPDAGIIGPVAAWKLALAADLLREWSHKDPVAACSAMTEVPKAAAGRMAAFREWLQRDSPAVEAWMNSGNAVPADLRKAWLSELVRTDPGGAIQQLAGLAPEAREASLLEWSTSCALLPAEREALLTAVRGDPSLLRKCAGRIAAALADRSVEEAYEFVDGLELDEEMAASIDDGIFAKWATREPQVAFAAWAEQKESRVPDSFLHAMDAWSLNSPGTEQAIRWVETLDGGPAKERIQLHLIEDLTASERFDQAVRMGLGMENREEGLRQAMRAAAAWKEKFPDDARKRLAVISGDTGMELP
jgi:hypothetical protein